VFKLALEKEFRMEIEPLIAIPFSRLPKMHSFQKLFLAVIRVE